MINACGNTIAKFKHPNLYPPDLSIDISPLLLHLFANVLGLGHWDKHPQA